MHSVAVSIKYFKDDLEIHTVVLQYYVGISYGQSKSLMVCTDCMVLSYMRIILVCMSIYSFVVLMFTNHNTDHMSLYHLKLNINSPTVSFVFIIFNHFVTLLLIIIIR